MGIHISLVHEIISDMCIPFILCMRARVFSGIIEFQTLVNPSRVKTSGANIACSFNNVDALYYNSCVYGDTHITTP